MRQAMSCGNACERGLRLRERRVLGRLHSRRAAPRAEIGRRARDPRPVELREAVDLDRVGVRQRERVAAPAVERVTEMQHLSPARRERPEASF